MHLFARTSPVSVGLCLLGFLSPVAESTSSSKKYFIQGQKYVKLNQNQFRELVSVANLGLPDGLTKEQTVQIIQGANGGPGSINMPCVSLRCSQSYRTCLHGGNGCDEDVACVRKCSVASDTTRNSSLVVQKDLYNCYLRCNMNSRSAIFKSLKKCAQFSNCIQKFTPIEAPVPSFISASPLSILSGKWNIVAGLNPGYDQIDNAVMTFNRSWGVVVRFPLPPKKGNNPDFKIFAGNIIQLFPGIYYYSSSTRQGAWYNLGTSESGKVVVIYYTASNLMANWFGGFVIKKEEDGATNELSEDEKKEVKSILEHAFAIPPPRPDDKQVANTVVQSWKPCFDPKTNVCAHQKDACCISYDKKDIESQKYTCRPKDPTKKECSAFPRLVAATLKVGKAPKLDLTGGASPMPDTSDGYVTFDDFKLLNGAK